MWASWHWHPQHWHFHSFIYCRLVSHTCQQCFHHASSVSHTWIMVAVRMSETISPIYSHFDLSCEGSWSHFDRNGMVSWVLGARSSKLLEGHRRQCPGHRKLLERSRMALEAPVDAAGAGEEQNGAYSTTRKTEEA